MKTSEKKLTKVDALLGSLAVELDFLRSHALFGFGNQKLSGNRQSEVKNQNNRTKGC